MNEQEWHYVKDGRQCGPVSQAKLVELLREGTLGPETLVWTQEMEDWRQASAMDGLVAWGCCVCRWGSSRVIP
ncbi:MAG: DUF4339 domain-containing protein [Planctomycetota bacterium]